MQIHKDASGALIIKGPLVVSEIESIHSKIEPLLDETIHEIILDLSGVEDIDISGLQLLYAIKKSAESEGSFRIKAINPQIQKCIIISGFDAILKESA